MRTGIRLMLGAAAAVTTLVATAPAQAQGGRSGRRHNPPIIRQVPPPPLLPNSPGLLEEGFQAMRRSSPRPNDFLYGRWNPSYEVIRPPIQYQPGHGGGHYGPIYGGFPYGYPYGYPYGGGYYSSFGYGYGYPYAYGSNNTIVQREIYVYPPSAQPSTPQPAQPRVPERAPVRPSEGGDFYLRPGEPETLSAALDDIRKAWLNGDFNRLQSRLNTEGQLRIFVKGQYRYAVDGRSFGGMVRDAMAKIDTVAFEFDRPKGEQGGRAFVTGRHTFVDGEKQKQTTFISYMLEKVGGPWKITEAGSSSEPITAHVTPPAK